MFDNVLSQDKVVRWLQPSRIRKMLGIWVVPARILIAVFPEIFHESAIATTVIEDSVSAQKANPFDYTKSRAVHYASNKVEPSLLDGVGTIIAIEVNIFQTMQAATARTAPDRESLATKLAHIRCDLRGIACVIVRTTRQAEGASSISRGHGCSQNCVRETGGPHTLTRR